ncbi:MAG: hypothetical protein RJQ09_09560 [Cyclobacteriaceae bacterium]
MKTRIATKKQFDAVEIMRKIRDKIDKETEGLDFEQLQQYYRRSAEKNKVLNDPNI